MWRLCALVAAGLCIASGFAFALADDESLAEMARRDQERRAATSAQKPARTWTNEDLAKAKGTVSTLGTARPTTAAPVVSGKPDAEAASRKAEELRWRGRFAEARQAVKDAEARAWVDTIEPVLVAGMYVPMHVRKFVETEELRQARQALVDLEEELRRSGGLPGWGRE
jgi:hypothetical protein